MILITYYERSIYDINITMADGGTEKSWKT